MHKNPFTTTTDDRADAELAHAAASGDQAALEALVRRHQTWVYNLSIRMMLNPEDAADLTQEALIRVVTRIAQFEGRSTFRTWAYRIVVNTMLNARRGKLEKHITTFEAYGSELDAMPNVSLTLPEPLEPERRLIVEETKIGCMLGMLLCLSRGQRLVYVLGEIFEAPSPVGAEILEISAAAFRKRLERARADLTAFMNEKCGLLETSNPCRCERKTTAFIEAGWVDPGNRKFAPERLEEVKTRAASAAKDLDRVYAADYAPLFREHPTYPGPDLASALRDLVEGNKVRRVFDLDPPAP